MSDWAPIRGDAAKLHTDPATSCPTGRSALTVDC